MSATTASLIGLGVVALVIIAYLAGRRGKGKPSLRTRFGEATAGSTTDTPPTAGQRVGVAGAGAPVPIGSQPAAPVSPIHQLPSQPAVFMGRDDELADLEKKLATDNTIGAIITGKYAGVQGAPGVGKTALAVVLAHRLRDRCPDIQLHLNLHGDDPVQRPPVTPIEAMQRVIHDFRPEARLPDTLDALAPLYRAVLIGNGRVMLLLDNAADAAQVQPLVPPPNCLLLVTSREHFTLTGMATRNIDCLRPAKSQELLLKLAPRIKGHEKEAAELCGHLPLALQVLAGAVNDKSFTDVPELFKRLREPKDKDKIEPVDGACEVSYELLSEEQRLRWTQLSVFTASFDLPAAAAVWTETPLTRPSGTLSPPRGEGRGEGSDSTRKSMQALVNAGLVEKDEADGRFQMHDLVRQFCDGKLTVAESTAARFRHAGHYCETADLAQQLHQQGGEKVLRSLELFDLERTHFEAAFEFLAGLLSRSLSSAPVGREGPDEEIRAATLLLSQVNALAWTSDLRFHPRLRIRWLEAQRHAARITKDRKQEGTALGNLGVAHADLGDTRKAVKLHEQQLVIGRETADPRAESDALGNLGNAHRRLNDASKAIEFYEQALDIDRKAGDQRREGSALGNLGLAYADLGDSRKAIELQEQSLLISRNIRDRRGEGAALGRLGNAHALSCDVRKAIELYDQQLVLGRETGDRAGEGNALGNLGIAHRRLGDALKAIGFYEQRLVIARETGDQRGEGNALWNSSLAFDELGDRAQAITHAESALRIYEASQDPNAGRAREVLAEWRAQPGK